MSDLVLGALIGVGAAVLGSVITGIINYKNSKLQINAHRYEVNQQQKYNEQQAQFDRVIKARENVLISLREAVAKWLELENSALVKMFNMAQVQDYPDELREEMQGLKEVSQESQQALSKLETFRGQISDVKLDQMIEEAKNICEEKTIKMMRILALACDPQNWNAEKWNSIMKERELVLQKLRDKVLVVNKRVEELLTGEPYT